MTAHVHLALVFHQHQPVGNYGFVFDELFRKSYEPLVACLERHPGVKAGLHYSGPLLDWLSANKPGYIERVRALVQRGQVEMLGGGYYEPCLPAIPHRDRVGQLRKMRAAIEALFGTAPGGMWLAERVWEPDLPRAIDESGYSWTIVDDVHFEASGFPAETLDGWYLTENDGHRTGLFASSTAFRYLVPWGTVESCIDFLRAHGDRHRGGLVVMGDDGEKFGGWPTTFAHCWEEGWVDAFFSRLEADRSWIETVHLGAWQRDRPPSGLAYLPSAAYMEMGEWALPPEGHQELARAQEILRGSGAGHLTRYLRGAHWRNFLVRYPEVNALHKRLLILSAEAHRQGNAEALEEIWQAQCNCPYWHGVFGGVYLEHIRHANFGHLAAADAALLPGPQPPDTRDWDFDGHDETCLRNRDQLIVIDDNGALLHWELRKVPWHLTHVVARRPEAYHSALAQGRGQDGTHSIHDGVRLKDPEAASRLFDYDRGLRIAAQDTVTREPQHDYRSLRGGAPGSARMLELSADEALLECASDESVWGKRIRLDNGGPTVTYETGEALALYSEWNLSLPGREEGAQPLFQWGPGTLCVSTGLFQLHAEMHGFEGWHEQLFSASNTEDGVQLQPQGWAITFKAAMVPGRSASIAWTVAP